MLEQGEQGWKLGLGMKRTVESNECCEGGRTEVHRPERSFQIKLRSTVITQKHLEMLGSYFSLKLISINLLQLSSFCLRTFPLWLNVYSYPPHTG